MRLQLFGTVFLALLLAACDSVCENVVSQTIFSPSEAFKAVVFSRNCGATTGFNTQISILPANEPLLAESGNTFITNKSVPIVVRWGSDLSLQIVGVGDIPPIKQNSGVSGVTVTYAK